MEAETEAETELGTKLETELEMEVETEADPQVLVEREEVLLGMPVLLRKEYISNCVTLLMEDGLILKKVKNVLKQNQEIGKKQKQELVQIQKHNMEGNLALGRLLRLETVRMHPKLLKLFNNIS